MKWNYLWIFLYCFVCEVQGQNNWYSNYNYIESFNEGVAIVKKNAEFNLQMQQNSD